MVKLQVETVTLPPDEEYPLFITANRYWSEASPSGRTPARRRRSDEKSADAGLTLICLHSTSFHKETWEACLETLFEIDGGRPIRTESKRIHEAWTIEAPNHGDSATLNEEVLQRAPFSSHFGCEGYSRAVHRFLTKGKLSFQRKSLVGIGHSLGANTILMIQSCNPPVPFKSLVIIEPMVSPGGDDLLKALRARLIRSSERRRDSWSSIDEARASLPGRVRSMKRGDGKKEWDDRVVDAFLRHGIRSADRPPAAKFTLACTREQEILMYRDKEGSEAPVKVLDRILPTMPVHLILGDIKDYVPREVHEALAGPASGRKYASVKVLPHVGHLVPQEQPDALAEAIAEALGLFPPLLCKL